MARAQRYTLPDHYFSSEVEDGGLLPSNATYDELPPKPWLHVWPKKKEGHGWDMVEDHRERKAPYFNLDEEQEGTPYWMPSPFGDDTWDSQPRITKEAGPLPKGHRLVAPEKPLSVAQGEKRTEINTTRDQKEQGGFVYLGKVFDSDPVSGQRLSVAATTAGIAASLGNPFEIEWTLQDNTSVLLTGEQMIGAIPALAIHGNTVHGIAKELKAKVDAATTQEEVEAVKWPTTT